MKRQNHPLGCWIFNTGPSGFPRQPPLTCSVPQEAGLSARHLGVPLIPLFWLYLNNGRCQKEHSCLSDRSLVGHSCIPLPKTQLLSCNLHQNYSQNNIILGMVTFPHLGQPQVVPLSLGRLAALTLVNGPICFLSVP